ncbi:hypothetical protein AB0284_19645 [Pseudarthrobacter phenanthrenivorans]|jgi:hypothetical protein|uniref:hypothetical protein n=1 Tax=Pseudarthrobacter phenanthrenivorans TaxID=361575 RepID=UPI00344D95AC
MTELTEPDHPAARPAPEWPHGDAHDPGQGIKDPQVAQAIAGLRDLPGLPAADHEAVYNRLHDDLLAALNSDPANSDPTNGPPTNSAGGAS